MDEKNRFIAEQNDFEIINDKDKKNTLTNEQAEEIKYLELLNE